MARATSIISTSGAGASLEARIAATYLAAMLAEASGPGDDAAHVVTRVEFQRTQPAAGFDDLHVHRAAPSDGNSTTYLQIKRTLTGARSDDAFRRPIADAARLLAGTDVVGEIVADIGIGPANGRLYVRKAAESCHSPLLRQNEHNENWATL